MTCSIYTIVYKKTTIAGVSHFGHFYAADQSMSRRWLQAFYFSCFSDMHDNGMLATLEQ